MPADCDRQNIKTMSIADTTFASWLFLPLPNIDVVTFATTRAFNANGV
jgi:hypothetical protein